MHFIRILSRVLPFVVVFSPLSFASQVDGSVEVSGGWSFLRKCVALAGAFRACGLVGSVGIEISDYGEMREYLVLNPEYYVEVCSFNVFEVSGSGEVGVQFHSAVFYASVRMSLLSALTQFISVYYGAGVAVDFGNGVNILAKVSDVNLMLGEMKFVVCLSYTNELFRNLLVSFSKDTASQPSLEVFSEVKVFSEGWIGLNLGGGTKLNFTGAPLYPYKVLIRVTFFSEYEVYSVLRFSENLVESGVGLVYVL